MNQIKALISQLSLRQKVSILVAVVIAGILLTVLVKHRKESDFKPLYTGISQEDASAIVQKLKETGVEYRVAEDSGTVMVPSSRVAETRLAIAGAGLPKTGRLGFELFDKTNFGATDFTEQVNYRRALEGELERSVMGIAAVEHARIHITFPKDSVFLESRQPAKASVMVHLRDGSQLTKQNVAAVNYMVASAVEGLTHDGVTIVDERGNLLSRPRPADDGVALSETALEYRQQIERDLLNKVNNTLEPLLGAEKYRVGVSVDCDFSSGEQSEELMDPKGSVPSSTQRTEESTAGGAGTTGGIPGTASSLPRPTTVPGSRAGSGGILRTSENVAYQNSRVVKHTTLAKGAVKRISVAVLIDQNVRWEGTGSRAKRVLEPPPPERLKAIRDVVAGTIGYSEQRTDQIIVESLPFDSTLNKTPPAEPPAKTAPPAGLTLNVDVLMKNPKMLGAVAGGIVLLLLAAFGVRKVLKKRTPKNGAVKVGGKAALPQGSGGVPATTTGGAPGSVAMATQGTSGAPGDTEAIEKRMESKIAEQQAARSAAELEAVNSLKLPNVTTKKADVLAKHLREEIKKDPRATAQLVRSWLNDT